MRVDEPHLDGAFLRAFPPKHNTLVYFIGKYPSANYTAVIIRASRLVRCRLAGRNNHYEHTRAQRTKVSKIEMLE